MRKLLIMLLVLCSLAGVANAQSSSIGLRAGFPTLISVVYGMDFEAGQRGLGARFMLTGFALPVIGGNPGIAVLLAAEILYRVPIPEIGLNFYAGLGAGLGLGGLGTTDLRPVFVLYPNFGFELTLFRGLSFIFDLQPAFASNYIGNFQYILLAGAAFGLSYRF